MKWISHKLTTFAIYYTISGAPIQSLLASTSSILPDGIEMGPGRVIFRKHRGTSHNPLLWFLTLPVLFCLLKNMLLEIIPAVPRAHIPEPEDIFRDHFRKVLPFIKAQRVVPYLTPEEDRLLLDGIKSTRHGQRDCLLILLLFQTGLRISEALSLTPSSIQGFEGKPVLSIVGKGRKPRLVACPERLADRLKSYAYEKKVGPNDRFFRINRSRAWQIINEASKRAGFSKRVYPHLPRHSDAIERLRQTGNPKALQLHLGHSSTAMTMRYLSTLAQEDAVRINQEVSFDV